MFFRTNSSDALPVKTNQVPSVPCASANPQRGALAVAHGSVNATMANHRARRMRNGLSRWYIDTPTGRRAIKLQAYRGKLYLYGQLIDRSGSAPFVAIPFETPLAEIVKTYGRPFPQNNEVSGPGAKPQRPL
jgi:hypothetical protein